MLMETLYVTGNTVCYWKHCMLLETLYFKDIFMMQYNVS